ncbi:hypothetical protein T440DRAFT_464653 [Plenodomus tracheiphilus IPT5]|uniref:Uncharacterized protein n=1 Tax=Plenodomus tracheiphilus IPT5 TaxID=1408161 RepID=A0A6A7BG45_9PLEO|nr:hypothetical protein T440DRAFT_464653 [Plenodomus tracheiphilus IPT5]
MPLSHRVFLRPMSSVPVRERGSTSALQRLSALFRSHYLIRSFLFIHMAVVWTITGSGTKNFSLLRSNWRWPMSGSQRDLNASGPPDVVSTHAKVAT